jgi:1,4-alpha-glucan branching enzyme
MMTWNNGNYAFNEGTMGWVPTSDLSRLFWTTHTFPASDNVVSYMESHDEERLMYKNETYGNVNTATSYSTKDIATGLKRQELAAAYFFSAPGPKMVWEFGERGYDISIDNGGRLGDKPPHWEYMNDPLRKALYNRFAKFIKMKIKNPVFTTSTIQYVTAGYIKSMALTGTGTNVEVVGNFDVSTQSGTITFPSTGTYYDYITGATINVATAAYSITLAPGEYHIYSSAPLN